MRIDSRHPIAHFVYAYLDGERLRHCLWADDEEGVAEVYVTRSSGRGIVTVWDEKDGRFKAVTRIVTGNITLRYEPQDEERLKTALQEQLTEDAARYLADRLTPMVLDALKEEPR